MLKKNKKGLLLLSGGADSVTILPIATKECTEVKALFIDYGQPMAKAEYGCSKWQAKKFGVSLDVIKVRGVVGIPFYNPDQEEKTYIPFRNGIILSLATNFAEYHVLERIYVACIMRDRRELVGLGEHKVDLMPDLMWTFFGPMQTTMHKGTMSKLHYNILLPFAGHLKADVLKKGTRMGIDYSHTLSCYRSSDYRKPCGKCLGCVDRRRAFFIAGLRDPHPYEMSDEEFLKKYGGFGC